MAIQVSIGDSFCSMAEGGEFSKKTPLQTKSAPTLLTTVLSECCLPKCEMMTLPTLLPSRLRGMSSFFTRTKHSTNSDSFCSSTLILDFK